MDLTMAICYFRELYSDRCTEVEFIFWTSVYIEDVGKDGIFFLPHLFVEESYPATIPALPYKRF